MTTPLIAVTNLSCERDDKVLFEALTFDLNAGELVQIAGPNGAGKSTLIRILAGLYSNYEGAINRSFNSGDLVYLGHKVPIKNTLTASENIASLSVLGCNGLSAPLDQTFEDFGLAGYQDILCSDLSEGQRRRVALMRVCLLKPKLFLLDEPFSALDFEGVAFLEETLERISANGTLIVFTSHHAFDSSRLRKISLG